jgi:hypothetical protein
MILELLTKGIAAIPPLIPQDWDENTVIRLEHEIITITFRAGTASLSSGECPEAASIIQLPERRLCDIIDGTIDFMTVWRELAEPSPTDRRYILKGSGAKLFTLVDLLSRTYKSNADFKSLLDTCKTSCASEQ